MAARVPRTTAPVEAVTATSSDSSAASQQLAVVQQLRCTTAVENPPQTFTSGEALKE